MEIIATGVPAGVGEPVFDKLEADIGKALLSIGAVKGIEFGAGFKFADMTGSEANDQFCIKDGKIVTDKNDAGGILGGISNSMPIVTRIVVKPTSSIRKKQKTVNIEKMKEVKISVTGRHDPCVAIRVPPVAEAMVSIVLADHLIRSGFINPVRLR